MRALALALVALAAAALPAALGASATRLPTILVITAWPDETKQASQTWTLRCTGPGAPRGTLPNPRQACRRLGALGARPFAPTPKNAVCTQIYGGPQRAVVRGTYLGRRVVATFSRRDGCEIARWNRLSFLFPIELSFPA